MWIHLHSLYAGILFLAVVALCRFPLSVGMLCIPFCLAVDVGQFISRLQKNRQPWKYAFASLLQSFVLYGAFAAAWVAVGGSVHAAADTVAPSGAANQAGVLTRTRRFFYDNRNFRREISPEYWGARGGANGHSLHHWLFPQRAGMPQGVQNAGFNLINLPPMRGVFHRSLEVNTWMGWARNWGPQHAARAARVENGIRIGIPVLGTGTAYVGYDIGDELWELLNGGGAQ